MPEEKPEAIYNAAQPMIAVGAAESDKYPSRVPLWKGKPKLIGEVDRAPSPPQVAGAGEAARDMNELRATGVARSLLPSYACACNNDGDGELVPEEVGDAEFSSVPSVLDAAVLVFVVPFTGELEPMTFPEPGVN